MHKALVNAIVKDFCSESGLTLFAYKTKLMASPERQQSVIIIIIQACSSPFNKLYTDWNVAQSAPFAYQEPAIEFYMQELVAGCQDKLSHTWVFKGISLIKVSFIKFNIKKDAFLYLI